MPPSRSAAFRGTLINSDDSQPSGLRMVDDAIVTVGTTGNIEVAESVQAIMAASDAWRAEHGLQINDDGILVVRDNLRELLVPSQNAILPGASNTHDHTFQPPGIPGELIRFTDQGAEGWLPDTLREGEYLAKTDPARARLIARIKLREFAANGMTSVLQYTTSSVEAAEIVLEEAEAIGIRIVVGYACMDQGMNHIQSGLETSGDEAVQSTEYLLRKYGPKKIAVIDRFPIAVSSPTRRRLAVLAREYGALYETHCDESMNEKGAHQRIYGTPSIVQTLLYDGVFEPGSRVGLAHGIHTSSDEMAWIGRKIEAGCRVYIRACPNSNAQLGSHFDLRGQYISFPLRTWRQVGAVITLGTDQGAGRGFNIFTEAMSERGRHPAGEQPSYAELLRMATVDGAASLGIDPKETAIREGNKADFIVVPMAGQAFYGPNDHAGDLERKAGRTLEAGQRVDEIAVFAQGNRIKYRGVLQVSV